VLVDNHRTEMLAGELREMLRCFRCGACLNHCPVYGAIAMGSVVTPAMTGIENAPDLPHACTLNGRCAEVCPMSIPLPSLLRKHRRTTFERQLQSPGSRYGLAIWSWAARRPKVYARLARLAIASLSKLSRGRGRFASLPLAGAWTQARDLPAPQGRSTFMQLYSERERERARTGSVESGAGQ